MIPIRRGGCKRCKGNEEAAKVREANRQFLDDSIYDNIGKAGQPQAAGAEN